MNKRVILFLSNCLVITVTKRHYIEDFKKGLTLQSKKKIYCTHLFNKNCFNNSTNCGSLFSRVLAENILAIEGPSSGGNLH